MVALGFGQTHIYNIGYEKVGAIRQNETDIRMNIPTKLLKD
jgi:hypothetical protein